MEVYVLSENKKPLMPCKPVIARLLLKENKAKVVRKNPFTIQLLYDTTEYKQNITAGMDPGSKKLGCAAITNGKGVYKDVTKRKLL